jgi:hypothetical protein
MNNKLILPLIILIFSISIKSYCDEAPMPVIINLSITADLTKNGVQRQISKNVNCELSNYEWDMSYYTSSEFEDFKITQLLYYRTNPTLLLRLATRFETDFEQVINRNISNVTKSSVDTTTQYNLQINSGYTGTVKVKINYVKWNDGLEEGAMPTETNPEEQEETNQTNSLLTVIAIVQCLILGLYSWRMIILSKNQRNMI